jgi:hypothetical protein
MGVGARYPAAAWLGPQQLSLPEIYNIPAFRVFPVLNSSAQIDVLGIESENGVANSAQRANQEMRDDGDTEQTKQQLCEGGRFSG